MKLIKLMYIIDRTALLRWGYSVTGDAYVAMKHGPVLSRTLNNIREQREESDFGALSEAEIELVEEVVAQHGHKSAKQLRDYMHTFPEWSDPSPARVKSISVRDILEKNGISEDEATGIIDDINAFTVMDRVFS